MLTNVKLFEILKGIDRLMDKNCTHHFILEPPNGVDCLGKCKKCGFIKTHFNSSEGKTVMREIKKGIKVGVKNITLTPSRSPFNKSDVLYSRWN